MGTTTIMVKKGGEERGQNVGHMLLHELFNHIEHRHGEHDGQNRLRIVSSSDLDTVNAHHRALGSGRDNARGNKDATAEQAEHRVGAELLCGCISQVDWQEVKAGLVQRGIKERVRGIGFRQKTEYLRTEDDSKGTEQTSSHNQRDKLDHRAGEVVESRVADALERKLLLGSVVEVLVDGGTACNTGDGDKLFKNLGHILADDDLELAAGELATQNALDLLNLLDLGLVVVLERKAQTRHAVGGDLDVLGATNELEDLGGNLLVVCHGTPPQ